MSSLATRRIGLTAIFALIVAMMALALWSWQSRYAVSADTSRHMDVVTAHQKAVKGDIVLVDVRRASEWRDTGIPASAHAITMHQDRSTFVRQLLAAAGNDKDRPLAVICARGVRTAWLQDQLREAGFTQPINVTEGMLGSQYGPGWLKKRLPVRPWQNAASSKPVQ